MGFAEVSKMETSSIHSIESFCIAAMSRLPDLGRLCWEIVTSGSETEKRRHKREKLKAFYTSYVGFSGFLVFQTEGEGG